MTATGRRARVRPPLPATRISGSLRTQLIFWNVVALSLLLGALGIVCRLVTFSFMIQSVDRELLHTVEIFKRPPPFEHDEHGGQGRDPRRRPPRGTPNPAYDNPYHPRLYDMAGKPFMPEDTPQVWDAAALRRALHGETLYTVSTCNHEPVRVLSTWAIAPEGRGAAQCAYPLKEVYRALSGVDRALLLLLPIGLFGAWWMGSVLTTRILRRMQQMTQAAARFGAPDLARRLPVAGNDEFSELAATFNALLGRLETAFHEQERLLVTEQRFIADASHELKTPLTVIKGRAGLGLSRSSTDERSRRAFHEIDEAAGRMAKLTEDLLLLARADEGHLGRDPIELLLNDLLDAAIAQTVTEGAAPISLSIEPTELCVMGNEAELIRLFRNLLDNARRYTTAEGSITVTARETAASVTVNVADTGAGIAPEHLPHLGERFYRADASRTRPTGGTGLGISICRGIAAAHGGAISFASEPGKGTSATVTLPNRAPSAPGPHGRVENEP